MQLYSSMETLLRPYLGLLLPLVVVLYYLSTKFNPYYYGVPGPFLASFTSLWKLWDTSTGESQYTRKLFWETANV